MSSTLTVEPTQRKKQNLSSDLKFILRKKFGGTINQQIIDEYDLSYLKGLLDCGITDAQILIDLIGKFGELTLNEEW